MDIHDFLQRSPIPSSTKVEPHRKTLDFEDLDLLKMIWKESKGPHLETKQIQEDILSVDSILAALRLIMEARNETGCLENRWRNFRHAHTSHVVDEPHSTKYGNSTIYVLSM